MRITRIAAVCAAALGILVPPSESRAQPADFYAGKRLVVLVNYAPGGPADIEGRFFARHIAKHIAGAPSVIVQNMDGAGGMVGASYLGEVAPKDGTMLGMLTASAWQFATESTPRKVDFKTYEFVAYQPSTTVYFMRTDVAPGIKTPADLGRAQGIIAGGLSADSAKDLMIRLTLDMLGHKYKYVTGYRGSNGARLAMQQKEINFYSESPPSYRTVVMQSLVDKGDAIGLFYDPGWDGTEFKRSKQVEGLPIKSFPELYREIKGEMPKGPLWDMYRTALQLTGEAFRVAALPPGSPKAAVDALRSAITKLATDKEFAEEAMKAFSYVPEFVAGPDTSERLRKMLNTSPELRKQVSDYVKAGAGIK
jgi:tripartite-type tricarboxylate transporter receptor subunit TctC